MKLLMLLDRASAWHGYLRLEITTEENAELYRCDSAFRNLCTRYPDDFDAMNVNEWLGYVGRSGRLCVFLRVPCAKCGVAFYCACMRALDEKKVVIRC